MNSSAAVPKYNPRARISTGESEEYESVRQTSASTLLIAHHLQQGRCSIQHRDARQRTSSKRELPLQTNARYSGATSTGICNMASGGDCICPIECEKPIGREKPEMRMLHRVPVHNAAGPHDGTYSIDRFIKDIDPREKVRLGVIKRMAQSASSQSKTENSKASKHPGGVSKGGAHLGEKGGRMKDAGGGRNDATV